MVSRFVALSGLLALALNAVPVARADVLELADGRVIEGVAVRDGDVWRVASRFGVVELPAADVKNHVAGPSLDAQIEGALAKLEPDDTAGRATLAAWLRDVGRTDEAHQLSRAVLAIDPEDATAHEVLGHVRYQGRWMSPDDAQRARGLERHGERWYTPAEWQNVDAIFTGDTDEEGLGRWRFPKQPLGETWPMRHDGIDYLGRFTSFRHVGVFPEQASHWRHMAGLIRDAGRPVKVLNLFGYTGLASLVAAEAGAEVTHVDASKKAIGWARENQAIARLENKPVRWICEDAMRFAEREVRRGNRYDIILLDPPAFGRGPKGEVWQLFEDLPEMVALCREILSEKALAMVLTAYAVRSSFFSIHGLLRGAMAGKGGAVESGELIIREETAGRALSTSMFSRWVAQ